MPVIVLPMKTSFGWSAKNRKEDPKVETKAAKTEKSFLDFNLSDK